MSEVIAKSLPQDKEDWMTKKWRPMMAVTYMAINIFDFILGPILYNLLQYWNPGQAIGMWQRVFGPSKKPAGFIKGLGLIAIFIMFKVVAETGRFIEKKDKQCTQPT